jgi:WD40 repeat protein
MTAADAATRRRNPYIGPRAFRAGETIYGRDRELGRLAALVIAERVVLLHSPSGAGKSSLIQAALVPRLAKPTAEGGENFRVLPLARVNQEPPDLGRRPAGFNRYVYSAIACMEATLPAARQRSPRELARLRLAQYLDQVAEQDDRFQVLIFDQFEEILTVDPTDWQGHDAFFREVGAALTDPEHPRWALFSMREEFIGGLNRYVRRVPTHLGITFRLDFLNQDAAQRAVQGPLAGYPVSISDNAARALVRDLSMNWIYLPGKGRVKQPGPYVEPVQLQVVCHRLWKSLSGSLDTIGEIQSRHLKQLKNVDRALADYYTDGVRTVAEETAVSERALRTWFETRLISDQGLRRQTSREPEPGGEAARQALARLGGEGIYLIRSESRQGEAGRRYELTHDRLVNPVRRSNAEWREQHLNRFQQLAERWEKEPLETLLPEGSELDEYQRWMNAQAEPTKAERRLLEAAKKAWAQRRLRRRLIQVAIGGLVIVLVLAVLAIVAALNAAEQRGLAQSREIVAAALGTLDDDPELSLLLALEAVRSNPPGQRGMRSDERDILYEAVTASRVQARFEQASAPRTGAAPAQPGSAGVGSQRTGFSDVALHPGGNVIAFASWTGGVELWSNKPPRHLRTLLAPGPGYAGGRPAAVARLAFSSDGRLAAADQSGTTTIWDVEAWRPLRQLRQAVRVTGVAFSRDGRLLATAAVDGTATVWDARSGRRLTVLPHPGPVAAVAFGKDDQLATASGSTIRLWAARSGRRTGKAYRVGGQVSYLAFSPGGAWLAAASMDGTAAVWETATGRPLPVLSGHTNSVLWVGFAPDGKRVATTSSDNSAKVWDARTGRELLTLRGHAAPIDGAAFVPNSTAILTASEDGTGRRWLVASGHAGFVNSVAFDPEHERLATASTDRTVRFWDSASRQQLRVMTGHRGDIRQVVFDRDGRRLATASTDGTARVWDAATGKSLWTIRQGAPVNAVEFAPDGRRLAVADADGTTSVWDVGSHERLLTFKFHAGAVNDLAWSPDGTSIATGGSDGVTSVTNATEAFQRLRLLEHAGAVMAVAFSRDGTLLASAGADRTAVVWDPRTGGRQSVLRGHTGPITDLAFGRGDQLATASWDRSARTWDAGSGREQLVLHSSAEVNSVAFSPDGRFLATAGSDRNFQLYPLVEEDLLEAARARRTRELTSTECQQYLHRRCPAPL